MLAPSGSSEQPTRHSLWRALADGSAGIAARLSVNLALAVFLMGAALLGAFVIAALVPPLAYQRAYGVRPMDELMAGVFTMAGIMFLGGTAWLWSRKSRHRGLLRPTLWTMGIAAVTIVACMIVVESFRGAEELIVTGLIFLAAAGAMLIWIHALYGMSRGRPLHNEQDGLPDIRCPACGYRMVGLRESRCPECGGSYTLDELLARQDFTRPEQSTDPNRRTEQAV